MVLSPGNDSFKGSNSLPNRQTPSGTPNLTVALFQNFTQEMLCLVWLYLVCYRARAASAS